MDNWYSKLKYVSQVKVVYCAWCKSNLSGEPVGYNSEGVSHGICQECKEALIDRARKHNLPNKKESKNISRIHRRSNDVQNITQIASDVRKSLLQDDEETLATLCLPVSRHLAKILIDHGYSSAHVVKGTFSVDNPDPSAYEDWDVNDFGEGEEGELLMEEAKYTPLHYWVQIGNIVIDITADQFNDELEFPVSEVIVDDINSLDRYTVFQENYVEPRIMYPWAIK